MAMTTVYDMDSEADTAWVDRNQPGSAYASNWPPGIPDSSVAPRRVVHQTNVAVSDRAMHLAGSRIAQQQDVMAEVKRDRQQALRRSLQPDVVSASVWWRAWSSWDQRGPVAEAVTTQGKVTLISNQVETQR